MRRLPVRIVLAALGLSAPACGSRTGLLLDGTLGLGLSSLDASDRFQDASVDADVPDAAPTDGAVVVPQDFVCPHRSLDVCGDNAYQPGSPWPTYQQCSPHTGRSTVVGPSNPVVLWGVPVGSALLGPPAIAADGTIYVAGGGRIIATNPDGTPRWTEEPTVLNSGGSTPAIGPDGTIYVALDKVYAYGPDGSLKWSSYQLAFPGVQSSFATLSSPGASVALGPCGTLFVGSPTGLHIMDANGRFIWDTPGQGLTPAVDPDGNAYYGTADGRLLGVNPDGTVRWTFSLNETDAGALRWTQPAPMLGPDGSVYMGESAGFHAVDKNGKQLWFVPWGNDAGGPLTGAALGADGTVYVAFPDLTLRALGPGGKQKWSVAINVYGTSPVIDGHGTIFELGPDGVFAITPDGQIAWALTLPGGSSQLGTLGMGADGTLYASTQGIYAIGNAK